MTSTSVSPGPAGASAESKETSNGSCGLLNGHAESAYVGANPLTSIDVDWAAWQLRKRSEQTSPLWPELPRRHSPLLWGWPDAARHEVPTPESSWAETAAWIERMAKAPRAPQAKAPKWSAKMEAWLAAAPASPQTAPHALQCIAAAYSLPALGRLLSAELWQSLCQRLLQAAVTRPSATNDLWMEQLLAAELPRVLAHAFPKLEPCASLAAPAADAVSAGMSRALDAEGMPRSEFLSLARPLLALWTRCLACGGRDERGGWSDETQARYLWFVRQSLRLSRPDGSVPFADTAAAGDADLLKTASAMISRNRRDRERYDAMRRGKLPRATSGKSSKLPACAVHSEVSRLAVMRPNWSGDAAKLVVDYGGPIVRCELSVGDRTLLSGDWTVAAMVDGRAAPAPTAWKNVCWISDEDVDYLELESQLSTTLRVQRQALVARKDGFVYLADVLVADAARDIECRTSWTLAAPASVRLARETREGQWLAPTPRGMILPLALPEWRLDPRGGELTASDGALELVRRSPAAQAIYSPLFLDLHRRRSKAGVTWRQLTIAETRVNVAPDAAAAYRVQSGGEQWLFYRALDGRGNRTVLGHNLVSEFLAARFERSGTTKAVVEIE